MKLKGDDDKIVYEKFVYLTQHRRRKWENQRLRPILKRDYVPNDVYPGKLGKV